VAAEREDLSGAGGVQHRPGQPVVPALAHAFAPCGALQAGKEVMVGAIGVASEQIETPEEVADAKPAALEQGVALAAQRLGV
jgi:methionine synthase II (cobalamin-independent)